MPVSSSAGVSYLSSADVAAILGITRRTLFNWIKAGKIPEPQRDEKNGYFLWSSVDVQLIQAQLMEKSLENRNL